MAIFKREWARATRESAWRQEWEMGTGVEGEGADEAADEEPLSLWEAAVGAMRATGADDGQDAPTDDR